MLSLIYNSINVNICYQKGAQVYFDTVSGWLWLSNPMGQILFTLFLTHVFFVRRGQFAFAMGSRINILIPFEWKKTKLTKRGRYKTWMGFVWQRWKRLAFGVLFSHPVYVLGHWFNHLIDHPTHLVGAVSSVDLVTHWGNFHYGSHGTISLFGYFMRINVLVVISLTRCCSVLNHHLNWIINDELKYKRN